METFFQQLINGISQGAIYALIAVGYTMVYGVLRLINFAHGDIYMVGAMMGIYCARWFRVSEPSWGSFALVLLASMAICGVLGFLIEFLAYRPLRNQPRITSLITAVGVSMLLEFGGQHPRIFGANPQSFPNLVPGMDKSPVAFHIGEVSVGRADVIIITLTFALMLLLRHIVL